MKQKALVVRFVFLSCFLFLIFAGWKNATKWMAHSHGYPQSASLIRNIELAMTKLCSDAGRAGIQDLLDQDTYAKLCVWYEIQYDANEFEARVAIDTRAAYALLTAGRDAATPDSEDDDVMKHTRNALRHDLIATLGTDYLPELNNDDWGNPFQFYFGPWPDKKGPVLLRNYLTPSHEYSHPGMATSPPAADQLTLNVEGGNSRQQGFPATSRMDVYIWSLGENGVSDQPRYDPTHSYAPPARSHYRKDATDEYLGGGDDINNWDKDQTFMRFYN